MMAIIFAFSSLERSEVPRLPGRSDLLAHALEHAILGGLLVLALVVGLEQPLGRAVALAMIVGIAHGAFDEWHQSFVKGRDSSVEDAVADAIGAIVGAASTGIARKRRG